MVRRTLVLFLVLVLALPVLSSTGDAQIPATPLDPILKPVEKNATTLKETTVGPSLSKEDVDVKLDMAFRDVDFDTINVIFGGGKFSAAARIDATIDFRVIAATRLQSLANAAAPGAGNLTSAAGADKLFIPADAFRTTLSAETVAAFQKEEQDRLTEFLRSTIPNVTVMNTQIEWANVTPQDSVGSAPSVPNGPPQTVEQVDDPTFPPITVHAVVDVQYLERTDLLTIIEKALASRKSEFEKQREEQVADTAATYDRSAFGLLGIRQVLALQAPEGWNVDVHVTLPEGFTFEEASPDVALGSDHREATVTTLGHDAANTVLNPVALTLSNRFIVSTAMLASVLVVGSILRFPALILTNSVRRRLRR